MTQATTALPSRPGTVQPAAQQPAAQQPAQRDIPEQIVIPRLNVHADVRPVISRDGVLQVPEEPADVGWWIGSALPGAPSGTVVIDGHIDSATAGVGAFFQLSTLVAGDSVAIIGQRGSLHSYTVVARRVYAKDAGLPPSIFASAAQPRLLLISCGGPFDADRGSYEDNIAVFAVPVGH